VRSLANAKKFFYRAFNAVFGKVTGVASEELLAFSQMVRF